VQLNPFSVKEFDALHFLLSSPAVFNPLGKRLVFNAYRARDNSAEFYMQPTTHLGVWWVGSLLV
jgi:hypothetical protein